MLSLKLQSGFAAAGEFFTAAMDQRYRVIRPEALEVLKQVLIGPLRAQTHQADHEETSHLDTQVSLFL